MNAHQVPTPDEARASLDETAVSRRAAVTVTRRPVWLDSVFAAGFGIALGVAVSGGWTRIALGMAILVAVSGLFAVLDRPFGGRRRGKILDERAVGAHAVRFLPMYTIVFVASQFRPGDDWQPWYSIGVGLVVALAGFVYVRLDGRYQARRLAAGDYDRYDLL